ncbi:hypothetical protein [Methylobacterium brachythecii]|uniref:Uncharacterized protein n=1 Tax=Methylobacterium brachythecii TaxID=1176177 RepID=A0A7W6AK07_9HYPH|nr:hypothetical protein [Methylobacterium brachythecii]MBB3901202.1 hypothetical protein [Methylobacterium brachythecii]GLS44615.1 hypothetical protein GCM10007884_26030 [Methylobacterium brachythecii]
MTSDTHEDALAPVPSQPPAAKPRVTAKTKLTGREARRKRRKARRRGEEILAWILVPLIVLGLWWGVNAVFDFFGTTPSTVWDQLMMAKKQLDKRGLP